MKMIEKLMYTTMNYLMKMMMFDFEFDGEVKMISMTMSKKNILYAGDENSIDDADESSIDAADNDHDDIWVMVIDSDDDGGNVQNAYLNGMDFDDDDYDYCVDHIELKNHADDDLKIAVVFDLDGRYV